MFMFICNVLYVMHLFFFEVESKRSGIQNEIGKEMKMKHIRGEPLPTVIEHFVSDSQQTTRIKTMIAEMIEFERAHRMKIQDVHAETSGKKI